MEWYALYVQPHTEIDVRDALSSKGIEAAVPREMTIERHGGKWRERARMFFPGYVFIGVKKMTDDLYHTLKHEAHVLRVLGEPTPLEADEALYIEMLTPTPAPLNASKAVKEGDNIRVVSGPLVGKEGRILKIDKRARRARVRITLFKEIHDINMSLIIVAP